MSNIVVFLDRDGTVTREKGVINHPNRLELEPTAGQAIANLNQQGIPAIILTNQAGVGRGIISKSVLDETHQRLKRLLAEEQAYVDGIYVCPHVPPERGVGAETCQCRKPQSGLAIQALKELHLEPEHIYVIGDRSVDIELAQSLNATGILVKTGFGLGEWEYHRESFTMLPAYVAENIEEAVRWILLQQPDTGRVMLPNPQYCWPDITEHIEKAVVHQLYTSISIGGYEGVIGKLEQAWADATNRQFAVSYNSGTMALYAAYYALGIGHGDEVIVPAYGFFATVSPLLSLHAIPVFCDVDQSGNLDPARLPELLSTKTKAIVVSHIFGSPANMHAILDFARRVGVPVLEDASHALGASRDGLTMGQCGQIAVFSLQAKKLCPAGEGGMLVCDDREIYIRATMAGHFKQKNLYAVPNDHPLYPYHVTGAGFKLRMHPLAAAIGLETLADFPRVQRQRWECAQIIWQILQASSSFTLLCQLEHLSCYNLPLLFAPHLVPQRSVFFRLVKDKGYTHFFYDNLVGVIPRMGIFTNPAALHPGYPTPSHELPCDWPRACDIEKRIFFLPLWDRPLDFQIAARYAHALVSTIQQLDKEESWSK